MTTVALLSGGVVLLIFGLGFLSSYIGKYEAKQSRAVASSNGDLKAGAVISNAASSAKVALGESEIGSMPVNRFDTQQASHQAVGG